MPRRKDQWGFNPALKNQIFFLNGGIEEPLVSCHRPKKPRLDFKKEAIVNNQTFPQLLPSEDPEELQSRLQIPALFQYNITQDQDQQKVFHSALQLKGINNENQQQQIRHVVPQQEVVHQASAINLLDEGVCSRRLMQYIYHLRNRPNDNNLAYWRKFVAEYYAPSAKKRWCLSSYDVVGNNALGIFAHVTMVPWHCNICGCKSRRGLDAIFEVLPRLHKTTFESGMIDELLFLDLPRECRLPSGVMMLEYERAVQESVYEQLRIVHQGRLRIIFSHDLKILSWEFCVCSHEVYVRRAAVAPQVIQLVHEVQDYKCCVDDKGSDGVFFKDLQANCNMIQAAGAQLAKTLDLQLVDDVGFSTSYTRSLQIAEVVNTMKDLMTLCRDNDSGPIESLKTYRQRTVTTKVQIEETEGTVQPERAQDPSKDNSNLMTASSGFRSNPNESSPMTTRGPSTGAGFRSNPNESSTTSKRGLFTSAELAASFLCGFRHELTGQSNLTSTASRANQLPQIHGTSLKPFRGPKTSHSTENGSVGLDPSMPQYTIQKLLKEIINSSRSANKREEPIWRNGKGSATDMPSGVWGPTAASAPGYLPDSIAGRSSSSKVVFNKNLTEVHGNCFIHGEPKFSAKNYLSQSILNISHGCHDHNTIYGNGNGLGYDWKA